MIAAAGVHHHNYSPSYSPVSAANQPIKSSMASNAVSAVPFGTGSKA